MKHRLQLDRISAAPTSIDPVFLNTPQFVCESLGRLLGTEVLLKIETMNPVLSFKGRGAELFASMNTGASFICASAGNFGLAMAYACRRREIELTVYAAKSASPIKLRGIQALGAKIVLHGEDFDAAKLEAKRAAEAGGTRMVEDSLDVETVEGAGTIGLELLELKQPLEVLLIPLGNGAMFNGIARVMKELSRSTEMITVQSVGAPAMTESWRSGELVSHDRIATIADGIGVRVPVPEALADMKDLADDAILVTEAGILEGMRLLHRHAGIVAEPSSAVGVAAIREYPERFAGRRVGTIVCGGNLTDTQIKEWLL